MFGKLFEYLTYPFVQYACIVAILIALCAAVLGVMLVLRRYSYIGDGLSHVAFGAMAVASILGFTNNMLIILPVTIVVAILILRTTSKRKIKSDALISMLSVGSMALGYLLISTFSDSANVSGDVCSTLFGSSLILTLSPVDVILCITLSVLVLVSFVVLYNKMFAITFDEQYSRATGMRTEVYNTIIAIIVASIIVLAMNLVGTLLISALVIFPALSAMRICRSYKGVTIFSAVFSVVCAILGLLLSIGLSLPVGPTIVGADIVGFVICFIVGMVRK